jgi:hypothetical protein
MGSIRQRRHQIVGHGDWVRYGRPLEYIWVSLSGHCIVPERSRHESVRALGETDLNPVSGLGKVSQLLFAWIQPGNVIANIVAGGVAEAGAQQYAVTICRSLYTH